MGGYAKRFQVLWCVRTVEGGEGIDFVGERKKERKKERERERERKKERKKWKFFFPKECDSVTLLR